MSDLKFSTRPAPAYDEDFFAWTQDQAEKLRARRHNEIDWDNLAEEIESVGRSDKRSIRSNLHVVLLHLLKWRFQPEKRKGGWVASIAEHRHRIVLTLNDSPSLMSFPEVALTAAYEAARREALIATGLPSAAVPLLCPYTIEQVLDPHFPEDLYSDVPE